MTLARIWTVCYEGEKHNLVWHDEPSADCWVEYLAVRGPHADRLRVVKTMWCVETVHVLRPGDHRLGPQSGA